MNNKLRNEELNRPDVESYKRQEKLAITVLLDDIRSLSNVGSIFRTSDAFNIKELVLCGITGRPPHRDIQRTALGATESVSWRYSEKIEVEIETLKQKGYHVISLEQCQKSVSPKQLDIENVDRIALILGNEVDGVKQSVIDLSDEVLEIPQSGTKHSLNVTVAAGIALWELYAGFKAKEEG